MTLEVFIESLYAAGWQAIGDAQHANIKELHKKLFPEIARLDSELRELQEELSEI